MNKTPAPIIDNDSTLEVTGLARGLAIAAAPLGPNVWYYLLCRTAERMNERLKGFGRSVRSY